MRDTTPFLTRLGLDASADARAIRRAYARELKLIDQERDGAAFQVLRQAYETALRWSEQPAMAEVEPEPPLAASPPVGTSEAVAAPVAPARAPNVVDAEAAFDAFSGASVALRAAAADAADWEAALQQVLASDALLNLEARTGFEARIVRLLLDGWKNGNEHLLAAAAKAFGWTGNGQHLQLFGHAGEVLQRATVEQLMFDARAEPDRSNQRRVLRHLRAGVVPAALPMRRDMVHAERMMERYPCLMPIIADMAALAAWRAHYQASIGALPDTAPPAPAPEPATTNWRAAGGSATLVLFLLFQGLRMCSHAGAPGSAPAAPTSFARLQPALEAPAPPDTTGLSATEVQELLGRVAYHPAPGEKKRVVYAVTLGAAGGVNTVQRTVGSGDTRFDGAVEAAIRNSPPFPATTPRRFVVDIALSDPGVARTLAANKLATALTPEQKKISQAQLEEIGHRIGFRVAPDSVPGNFQARFKVTIDAQGAVGQVELVHPSGDHRYDRAVEMALRQTQPLGPGYQGVHTLSYGITITSRTSAPAQAPQH